MARRSKPYLILCADSQPHAIAKAWWQDYLTRGLICPTQVWDEQLKQYRPSRRIAEAVPGVCAALIFTEREDGSDHAELSLLDYRVLNALHLYIGLNCRVIERYAALFCEMSAEQVQRAVQRDYCLRA